MTFIPIFVIVHNQLEILKKTVNSYEKFIKTPIQIIYHDVCSTYQPTIDYLNEKKTQGYTIYNSTVNNHHTVMDSVEDFLKKHPECEYYVITDPDIELSDVNGDILEFYIYLLNTYNKTSVGPMLRIDDIPDYYPRKKNVLEGHGIQFWNCPPTSVVYKNNVYKILFCDTDTTFQLRSSKNLSRVFPHNNSIRCYAPYCARHLDWYIDPNNLTPCQKNYMETTTRISHWCNKNWEGKYFSSSIEKLIPDNIN